MYIDQRQDEKMLERDGRHAGFGGQLNQNNMINAARAGGRQNGETPGYDVCCPNCQARGDFMQEVNKVLKNCIDFCEFPHKCHA